MVRERLQEIRTLAGRRLLGTRHQARLSRRRSTTTVNATWNTSGPSWPAARGVGKNAKHFGVGLDIIDDREVGMPDITVYWRPLCGYCEVLKWELDRRGLKYSSVDIWRNRQE